MIKKYQCWCCEEEIAHQSFVKNFGTQGNYKVCGACVGLLAVIESRLHEITVRGKLGEDRTANTPDVPQCEKE